MQNNWADEIYFELREKIFSEASSYVRLSNLAILKSDIDTCIKSIEAGLFIFPYNAALLERRRLLEKNSFSLRPAKYEGKVFGIGLSKTGTTSLNSCLEILGLRSKHWMDGGKILNWDEIFNFSGLTDTPISFQFETLYYMFPSAKFIYTIRDKELWKNSIEKHFRWLHDFDHLGSICSNGLSPESESIVNTPHWRAIHLNLYANHSSWIKAYEAHDNRVRNFFNQNMKMNFLEIDVTSESMSNYQKWLLVINFLGLDLNSAPLMPFPRKNFRNKSMANQDPSLFITPKDSWGVNLDIEEFEQCLITCSTSSK